jgi:predicted 2-oxoglutarate/Fe(II)-dependent dioxygenase YbiX
MPNIQNCSVFVGNDISNIELIKNYLTDNNTKTKAFNVLTKQRFVKDQRECQISWIPKDKSNTISSFLENLLKNANNAIWELELSDWQSNIQYTHYSNYNHHYDWHSDVLDSSNSESRRLLTIVYCLTPKTKYKGCKLEIRCDNEVFSKKLDEGDYAVFPSNLIHRATKLIFGDREVLVGWYK